MAYTFIIEPHTFNTFDNEISQLEQCKEWNLLSEKASKTKAFYYKGNGLTLPCSIVVLSINLLRSSNSTTSRSTAFTPPI